MIIAKILSDMIYLESKLQTNKTGNDAEYGENKVGITN
jgi:hypothetical protein